MLTQLTTVKRRIGLIDTDTSNDPALTLLIEAVLMRFARECRRRFAREAGATMEFPADAKFVVLEVYPLEAVTKIETKSSEREGWIEQTVDYLLRRNSVVEFVERPGGRNEVGRITYTGGYVLPGTVPGTGQFALPKDLEWAATEQCAHWWLWKDKVGLYRHAIAGGLELELRPNALLPQVVGTLKRYERFGG